MSNSFKHKNFTNRLFQFILKRSVFLLPLIFLACVNDPSQAKSMEDMHTKIQIETGTNVNMIYSEDAKPSIKILADKALRYNVEIPYTEFNEGMIIYFYDENGELESTLTANYGKMTDGSTDLLAQDDVVVINKAGEKLNTEHLIWDKEAELIKSEGFVKITTEDEIIYGNGFESDDKFSNYTIFQIKGTVNIKEED